MSETSPQKGSGLFRFVIIWAVASAMVLMGGAILLFLKARKNHVVTVVSPAPNPLAPKPSQPVGYTFSKSVSIALDEEQSGHGLTLCQNVRDGGSTIEQIGGVPARALR